MNGLLLRGDLLGHLPMGRSLLVLIIYVPLSAIIFLIWSVAAQTEFIDRYDKQGRPVTWRSVTGMIDGTALAPFVQRRLLPDSARVLAKAIPPSFWLSLTRAIEGDSWAQRKLRSFLDETLAWRRENYPGLFSSYFLIWLSTLGFLYACRSFASTQYEMPSGVATAVGAILGIGLLGGNGVWNDYSYDIPNAFLFVLALTAIVAKRWWLWPAFAAAAYSKETAVLLILAYALTNWGTARRSSYWMTLVALIVVFGTIRLWIAYRFINTPPASNFWFPARNARVLAEGAIKNMWSLSVIGVVIIRMARMWKDIPPDLRRLLFLVPVLLTVAFFKGWIEERRAYYEIYPIVGLVAFQWATLELGVGRFFRAKRCVPSPQAGPASAYHLTTGLGDGDEP
jgi:hypothetical protein